MRILKILPKDYKYYSEFFGYDPVPVDILCAQLALPYSLVAAQLVELELLGRVRLTVGGFEKSVLSTSYLGNLWALSDLMSGI